MRLWMPTRGGSDDLQRWMAGGFLWRRFLGVSLDCFGLVSWFLCFLATMNNDHFYISMFLFAIGMVVEKFVYGRRIAIHLVVARKIDNPQGYSQKMPVSSARSTFTTVSIQTCAKSARFVAAWPTQWARLWPRILTNRPKTISPEDEWQ